MDSLIELRNVCEDDFKVEFEILPTISINELTAGRKEVIVEKLQENESQIQAIQKKIDVLNDEIDRLTNQADGLDYIVAVASGIIAGAIDIIFVEDFSLEKANEWGDEKTNNFVVKIAQKQGYQGDDLYGAIKYLEDKYPIAADKATATFGGGKQHHLRDFSHHPTPVGLFFSLLTQFTHRVYGTNVAGVFDFYELKESELILIGRNFPEKMTFGVINWFFHMVSDMAGSSSSVLAGSIGTGLPGPIGSLLKEISVLPIFRSMNEKGYKEFSVWVSKLFNGTLLGEYDANGKIVSPMKFDLRTEIGIGHQLGQQAIPVIINECIVRGFYFIRRFFSELKSNEVRNISDLKNINWKNTLPFNNRTVIRMLTISTGTMTAIDLADAAIESAVKSGGVPNPAFFHNMIVKVNFVGIGRFAIAVATDVGMGVKKGDKVHERSKYMTELITLYNVKCYYHNADLMCSYAKLYDKQAEMYRAEADMWIQVKETSESMDKLFSQIENAFKFYIDSINKMDECFDEISNLLSEVEDMNPGLLDEMLRRLN